MKGLDKLPQERRARYVDLHNRLENILMAAVDQDDATTLYDAARYQRDLARCCCIEAEYSNMLRAVNISLSMIEHFCRDRDQEW